MKANFKSLLMNNNKNRFEIIETNDIKLNIYNFKYIYNLFVK